MCTLTLVAPSPLLGAAALGTEAAARHILSCLHKCIDRLIVGALWTDWAARTTEQIIKQEQHTVDGADQDVSYFKQQVPGLRVSVMRCTDLCLWESAKLGKRTTQLA